MRKLHLLILLFPFQYLLGQCPPTVTPVCQRINQFSYKLSVTIPAQLGDNCANVEPTIEGSITFNGMVLNETFDLGPCTDPATEFVYCFTINTFPLTLPPDLCPMSPPPFSLTIGTDNCDYTGAGILPVELAYFNAKEEKNTIVLEWQTLSETNNEGFEIYHSQDGKLWDLIGFQSGAGTTIEPQFYQFVDETAWPGQNYYRLRQIDFDGAFEFSSVVSANNTITRGKMLVFPNPANHQVYAYNQDWYTETFPETANLFLFDSFGRKVKQERITLPDNGPVVLNLKGLSKGIYFLEVQVDQRFYKSKILVQ